MSERDILYNYYLQQAGSGLGPIYSGPIYQNGYGVGNVLAKLFRSVLPYLRSGAKRVAREALKTGADIVGDIDNNVPFKESVKNQSRAALKRITGGTYKDSAFADDLQMGRKRRRTNKASIGKFKRKTKKRRKVARKVKKGQSKRRVIRNRKKTKRTKKDLSDIFNRLH